VRLRASGEVEFPVEAVKCRILLPITQVNHTTAPYCRTSGACHGGSHGGTVKIPQPKNSLHGTVLQSYDPTSLRDTGAMSGKLMIIGGRRVTTTFMREPFVIGRLSTSSCSP